MKMRVLWTMLLAFALTGPLVISAAAQDRDHDRDDQNRVTDQDRDHDRDHDRDRDRWENRDQWDYRTYSGDAHPEGWSRGDVTEWNNCGGGEHQYKCYTYQYQGQPYYYYRDDNGRVIVRRHHHDNDKDDWRRDDRDRDHDRDKH